MYEICNSCTLCNNGRKILWSSGIMAIINILL